MLALRLIKATVAILNDPTNEARVLFLLQKVGLIQLREGSDSPYVNLVVVRTDDVNDPRFQSLILALYSPEVVAHAKIIFKEDAVPAWE